MLSRDVLYTPYLDVICRWNIPPLVDQRWVGLVMFVAGVPVQLVGVWLLLGLGAPQDRSGDRDASTPVVPVGKGVKDRPSRLIAAILAVAGAIGVNTALLAGADAFGLRTAHGGLLRLLQDISGALAGLLDWTTWWRAAAGHIGRAVPIRLPRAHRLIQSLYNSYINSYRVTGL
jgi:hypothetical protein